VVKTDLVAQENDMGNSDVVLTKKSIKSLERFLDYLKIKRDDVALYLENHGPNSFLTYSDIDFNNEIGRCDLITNRISSIRSDIDSSLMQNSIDFEGSEISLYQASLMVSDMDDMANRLNSAIEGLSEKNKTSLATPGFVLDLAANRDSFIDRSFSLYEKVEKYKEEIKIEVNMDAIVTGI